MWDTLSWEKFRLSHLCFHQYTKSGCHFSIQGSQICREWNLTWQTYWCWLLVWILLWPSPYLVVLPIAFHFPFPVKKWCTRRIPEKKSTSEKWKYDLPMHISKSTAHTNKKQDYCTQCWKQCWIWGQLRHLFWHCMAVHSRRHSRPCTRGPRSTPPGSWLAAALGAGRRCSPDNVIIIMLI